jgi:hypothetical protein
MEALSALKEMLQEGSTADWYWAGWSLEITCDVGTTVPSIDLSDLQP